MSIEDGHVGWWDMDNFLLLRSGRDFLFQRSDKGLHGLTLYFGETIV